MMVRQGKGSDDAQRWAREQPWWDRVIAFCKESPCSSGKYYYWILKEEP